MKDIGTKIVVGAVCLGAAAKFAHDGDWAWAGSIFGLGVVYVCVPEGEEKNRKITSLYKQDPSVMALPPCETSTHIRAGNLNLLNPRR